VNLENLLAYLGFASITCSISNLDKDVSADSLPAKNPAKTNKIMTKNKVARLILSSSTD
jgi:hypothetical protein